MRSILSRSSRQAHETGKNPFMVDAPTFKLCNAVLRTLSICTCGESISDEEVAAYQDIMRCL
jgi:hypothetical protein